MVKAVEDAAHVCSLAVAKAGDRQGSQLVDWTTSASDRLKTGTRSRQHPVPPLDISNFELVQAYVASGDKKMHVHAPYTYMSCKF